MTTINFKDKDMVVRQLFDLAERVQNGQLVVLDHEWEMEQETVDVSSVWGHTEVIPGLKSWRLQLHLAPGRQS